MKVIREIIGYHISNILGAFLSDPRIRHYSHNNEIYQMAYKAVTFVDSNYVLGDYLEFGVGPTSFLIASKLLGGKRHLWGFDSFQGLPQPEGIDVEETVDGRTKWSKGQYKVEYKEFESMLSREGVNSNSYTLIKGYYSETLTEKYGIEKVAIAHIDCDLYASTKVVLNFVKPLLQTGTILLFDDYYCFKGDPQKGEAAALQEFLDANKHIAVTQWLKYHFTGNSFIVKIFPDGVKGEVGAH